MPPCGYLNVCCSYYCILVTVKRLVVPLQEEKGDPGRGLPESSVTATLRRELPTCLRLNLPERQVHRICSSWCSGATSSREFSPGKESGEERQHWCDRSSGWERRGYSPGTELDTGMVCELGGALGVLLPVSHSSSES